MLPVIPKTETRFWSIFRCLLIPAGAISFLFCIVMTIFTALGESAPTIDDQEVRGVAGVLVCLAAFPFVTLFGAFGLAVAIYFDRMKLRSQK